MLVAHVFLGGREQVEAGLALSGPAHVVGQGSVTVFAVHTVLLLHKDFANANAITTFLYHPFVTSSA